MRVFVAVPVPEALRRKVSALGQEIAAPGISLVRHDNMHLTLRFLGEIPDSQIVDVKKQLGRVKFKRFSCRIRGVGVFPNESFVRVVWAGCASSGALEALAKDVAGALGGYGGEERFTAHLTIARVKSRLDPRAFLEKHLDEEFGAFETDEFHLVCSVLGPGGPQYTTLAVFKADG
ncbi:RNA 2',3'-cyclic phosphodiesterase [Candidatus Micrarchaeota archaeon]|nr:RNA 2',3'-cyclic phosphodiesterase [Candidatus Micrarchaeota archaeon]